jgi:hypothetical protein
MPTQRALNGKLQIEGWGNIGHLLIRRNPNPVQVIKIDPNMKPDEEVRIVKSPFFGVLETLKEKSKPVWLNPKDEAELLERNKDKNPGRLDPRMWWTLLKHDFTPHRKVCL